VAGERTTGHGGFAILPGDRVVANSSTELFSDNRWFYYLRHQQPLADGVAFGVDLNEISDNNVVFDFYKILGRDLQHQRMLESSGWLSAARDGLYGEALLSTNNDLQSPNDIDRDGFFLQRLPDLRAAILPRGLFGLPLAASISSRFTNFVQFAPHRSAFGQSPVNGQFFDFGTDARPDVGEPTASGSLGAAIDSNRDNFTNPNAITKTEGDGIFEEGEPLADSGQRLDFFPKLTLPLQLGVVETLAEGGVRETLYFPNLASGTDSRTLFTARADARARFGRNYAIGTLPLSHIIEPRVAFAAVFAPNQSDNPLFIPEPARVEPRLVDGDIRLVTEDPSDRVPDARLLQLQLSNRLYGPGRSEGEPARLYGELRVGSGYDWQERAFTRVFALLDFDPSREIDVHLDGGWNPEQKHLEDLRASVGWHSEKGDDLRIGYRYNRNPTQVFEGFLGRGDEYNATDNPVKKINQVDLIAYWVATSYAEFFTEGYMSLESQGSQGGRIGGLYISQCKCWELLLELEKEARTNDTRVNVQFRLAGLGDRSRTSEIARRRAHDTTLYN
jgi:lipopolysaccharide assembly outer membrane protein LptD (OstA)